MPGMGTRDWFGGRRPPARAWMPSAIGEAAQPAFDMPLHVCTADQGLTSSMVALGGARILLRIIVSQCLPFHPR